MLKLPQFVRCVISSLISAGVDFLLFYGVEKLGLSLGANQGLSIVAATVVARIFSTAVNFLINKFWSFKSQGRGLRQAVLFFVLFVLKMGASAGLVWGLKTVFSRVPALSNLPSIAVKIFVDSLLFFASYLVQKKFIFDSAF